MEEKIMVNTLMTYVKLSTICSDKQAVKINNDILLLILNYTKLMKHSKQIKSAIFSQILIKKKSKVQKLP